MTSLSEKDIVNQSFTIDTCKNMENKIEYPSSIEEVIDDTVKYRSDVIKAMKKFKKLNPWQGSALERAAKLLWLHTHFCKIYGKNTQLTFDYNIFHNQETKNGNGFYSPAYNMIHLQGKVSVLTFLHEWGHNLHGSSEYAACWWSINLFRKIFPGNFKKLLKNSKGHVLIA